MEKIGAIFRKIRSFIKRIIRLFCDAVCKVFSTAANHKRITFIFIAIFVLWIALAIIFNMIEKAENNVDTSESKHGIVVVNDTPFYRRAKETSFGLIANLNLGERVFIIEEHRDAIGQIWCKVKSELRNRVGYVKKENVKYYEMDKKSEVTILGDVSKFDIEYERIKNKSDFEIYLLKKKINYVYIRAGGRGYGKEGNFYYDTEYDKYIEACEYLKIPYGFYYINNAKNDKEIKEEVKFMKTFIESHKRDYYLLPLVVDIEDFGGEGRLDKHWNKRGDLTQKVVNEFKKNDIDTLVYCNAKLANKYLKNVDASFWVAYYDEKGVLPSTWYDTTEQGKKADATFLSKIVAWQFTEKGLTDEEYKLDMSIVKNQFFMDKIKEMEKKNKEEEQKKEEEKENQTNEVPKNTINTNTINNTLNETENNMVNENTNIVTNDAITNQTNNVTENVVEGDMVQTEYKLKLEIGTKVFFATLYDNETTRALVKEFPSILQMKEFNGIEKNYEFSKIYPTKAIDINQINTGDIMFYGSNCLVLFYTTHNTTYRYTKIGKIDNVTGLKEALGQNDIAIRFSLIKN